MSSVSVVNDKLPQNIPTEVVDVEALVSKPVIKREQVKQEKNAAHWQGVISRVKEHAANKTIVSVETPKVVKPEVIIKIPQVIKPTILIRTPHENRLEAFPGKPVEVPQKFPKTLRIQNRNTQHIVVDALAGTGKTFTIEEDALRTIGIFLPGIVGSDEQEAIWAASKLDRTLSPREVYAAAFNSKIDKVLKSKLQQYGINCSTIHSLGKKVLAINGVRGATHKYGVRHQKTDYILADYHRIPYESLFGTVGPAMLYAIKQFVGFCKLNLITFSGDY
jgi:hypothetical protein